MAQCLKSRTLFADQKNAGSAVAPGSGSDSVVALALAPGTGSASSGHSMNCIKTTYIFHSINIFQAYPGMIWHRDRNLTSGRESKQAPSGARHPAWDHVIVCDLPDFKLKSFLLVLVLISDYFYEKRIVTVLASIASS